MTSQIVKPESWLSKDASKRKKLNRSAKMKQTKLDVRREQWLSQVRHTGKSKQMQQVECISDWNTEDTAPMTLEQVESPNLSDSQDSLLNNLHVGEISVVGGFPVQGSHDEIQAETSKVRDAGSTKGDFNAKNDSSNEVQFDSSSSELSDIASCSQQSGIDSSNHQNSFDLIAEVVEDQGMAKLGDILTEMYEIDEEILHPSKQKSDILNEWCGSDISAYIVSSSTTGSSSYTESLSEDEDSAPKEDDWEAVADAFDEQMSVSGEDGTGKQNAYNLEGEMSPFGKEPTKKPTGFSSGAIESQHCLLKPDYTYKLNSFGPRMKSDDGRAWRSNDISHPPTLPRLLKQQSAPPKSSASVWAPLPTKKVWSFPPAPSECPICTEELDSTDSSFAPCTCGFRLCLFCHHKIVVDDGRCPGCRKAYKTNVSPKASNT